ncbi:PTS mannitol transporter subunit IICBA [Arthrobacter sp. MDT1-48-3]|uniref:Mannitol-specific phosphotransferase enzyme IIA component n=1 Tax=Arthrobacter agilis TaxID=37921 RepID=A0A2L0UG68_9MICC|nr:PTS mannitol transporter subunit IICBA [Arthrobacter agilis]AUZ88208.1 PTS mannose transporter subunit IIA [Arthrobacter agilis]
MATQLEARSGTSARVRVQKFGTFLSGMIMPNIGAFIAWGLITALFIEAGYFPVGVLGGFGENAAGDPNVGLVGPMITYLLPLLIGYTGGKMIYETRGGVVGAAATMGVIVGTSIPMFIGAMIMGPLTAYLMKKIDSIWDGKIRPGFEMLVNNFAAGIFAALMAVFGLLAVGPLVTLFSDAAGRGVDFLVSSGLLPFTSILIEPAKILFLNNAINYGVLTPLATEQATETGKSLLFLLEANPGPGLGLLLAYAVFGRGMAKSSAPGAIIIQFLGGIHEIYFPYVLMKPLMVLAVIGGGMAGIFTLVLTGAGLRSPAAPGSIIAVYAATAQDSFIGITLSVLMAAAVSFLIGSVILKTSKSTDDDIAGAASKMEGLKGKKSSVAGNFRSTSATDGPIRNIVFACDAGMGSSAMGASVLRNKIKAAGFPDVKVTNLAIANLKDDYDVVVTHQDLAARAEPLTQRATHVSVDNFMNSPRYDEIVELVRASASAEGGVDPKNPMPAAAASEADADTDGAGTGANDVLAEQSVVLNGRATTQEDAINEAGRLLVERGAVDSSYVAAMHEREKSVPTYMGNFLAIPHGTNAAKDLIKRSAVSIVRYPEGIDWNGKQVKFVVGVAGVNNEHLSILSAIARVFSDKDQVAKLDEATSVDEVLALFGKVNA